MHLSSDITRFNIAKVDKDSVLPNARKKISKPTMPPISQTAQASQALGIDQRVNYCHSFMVRSKLLTQ